MQAFVEFESPQEAQRAMEKDHSIFHEKHGAPRESVHAPSIVLALPLPRRQGQELSFPSKAVL